MGYDLEPIVCGLSLPIEDQWWPSKGQICGISSHFGLILIYHHIADIYNTHIYMCPIMCGIHIFILADSPVIFRMDEFSAC